MRISQEMLNQIAQNMLSIFPMITKDILKKDEFTQKYGLPPRFIHILHLIDIFDRISISELAKRAKVSLPNMTPILDKLIEEGYVERVKDGSDRRVTFVVTTQKGKQLLNLHMQWVNQNLEKSIENLSQDEVEELWYLLKRLKKLVMKMIQCSCTKEEGEREIV